MLHLWYGNRMEALVETLLRRRADSQQDPIASLFTPLSFIVPNRQMDTFVRLAIARMHGIAVHVQSFFFRQFVMRLLANAPARLLTADVLQRFLFDLLRNGEVLRHALLEPVRSYLKVSGDSPPAAEHRCLQFAGEMARLFEEYSFTRPAMLRDWEDHAAAVNDSATVAWQRLLWRQVRAPGGLCSHSTKQTGVAWLLLAELGDWLLAHKIPLPEQLHVFGFSHMAESYHRLLACLAAGSAVHVYMLHPCLEDDWRMAYDDSQETPALRFWGRPGRENIRLLRARMACTVTAHFSDPAGETVLQRLQHDILSRHPTSSGTASDSADGSLGFFECPGLRREAEIVADAIWTLLAQESRQGPERLRFSDIAVIVPAAQQELYQAHIAAAFAECHTIPHSLIDLPPLAVSRVVAAITQLLALPLGSFTRRDVLQFLTHPLVRCRYPDVDTDRWLQWCDALSIVHGIDHQDHVDTYIEDEVFHWEQGLRRLLLGAFLSGERSGELQAFTIGEDAYLPYDFPTDQLESVALLIRLLRSLMADVRYAQTAQLSLQQWSRFVGCLVNAYIDASEDADARTLAQCLQRLEALADLEPQGWQGLPMSYQAAADFARSVLGDIPGQRGTYLTHGVAVSSCVPMRPIPFRVVFLLGLGESNFPAAEHDNPLDVRLRARQPGDVSRRQQDLYMFLETLVSTRQRLVLSYVCRDAHSGEPLPASPLWYDLRAMLTPRYLSPAALDACTVQYPVQRHDPRYFAELFPEVAAPLVTVLPVARTAARTLALRQHLQRWCAEHRQAFPDLQGLRTLTASHHLPTLQVWLGLADLPPDPPPTFSPEQPVAISLETLHQFLLCPLQAWGRWVLRLREATDDDLLAQEDEPFVTSPLATALLLREVFLEVWQHQSAPPTPKTWEAVYTEQARWLELAGRMPVGVLRQAERQRHLALLQQWNAGVQAAWGQVPVDLEVMRFGQAHEHERVDTLRAALELAVILPDTPVPLQVELYGRTDMVSPTVPGSLRLLLRRRADGKDVLRGFLDYVVLTATQHLSAHPYQSLVIARENSQQAAFAPLSPESARHYLSTLIGDFLGQAHAYLMPIEAVLKYDPTASAKTFAEVVKDCLTAQQYSSRYGPVPYPQEYPPPQEDSVQTMIARRFGLFHSLCQA